MGDLGRGLRGLVMIPWLMAASVWTGLAAMPWALWVTVRWLGRRGPLWVRVTVLAIVLIGFLPPASGSWVVLAWPVVMVGLGVWAIVRRVKGA
jgi:hypothetical protein